MQCMQFGVAMRMNSFCLLCLALVPWRLAAASPADNAPVIKPTVLFTPQSLPDGISVPLPSLLLTQHGTAIAVCELRKKGLSDFGHESDIILRRSQDGGTTWGPVQTVYADPGYNAINGPILEDRATGTVILTFTAIPANIPSQTGWVEFMARRGGSVYTIRSTDEGRTWSAPVETKPVGRAGWVAWPGNNSHGVQLDSGRLIIAGMTRLNRPGETIRALGYSSCILYSDDHGQSWRIGATTPFYGSDESTLAVCRDGSILVSNRLNNRTPDDLERLMTRSRDGGETYAELWMQNDLSLSRCHASMLQWVDRSLGAPRYLLAHCGPQGGEIAGDPLTDRTRLTLRLSYDDGRNWTVSRLLIGPPKSTEYSDLAVAPNGDILCLFSSHQHSLTGSVELIRFSLADVEEKYSPIWK